jgi:hypothetical protein
MILKRLHFRLWTLKRHWGLDLQPYNCEPHFARRKSLL